LPEQLRPEYYGKALAFLGSYIWNTVLVGCGTMVGVVALSSLAGYVFARIDFRGKKTVFLLILALMMIPNILTLIPAFIWYKEFPFVGGNDWLGQGGTGFLDTYWVLLIPYIAGADGMLGALGDMCSRAIEHDDQFDKIVFVEIAVALPRLTAGSHALVGLCKPERGRFVVPHIISPNRRSY
jgi:hypothetical protein